MNQDKFRSRVVRAHADMIGGSPPREPSEPSGRKPIWQQSLPKTVAEVKKYSSAYTEFEKSGLADEFEFKLWCVLIPKPVPDPQQEFDSSKFLVENREAFGNSLGNDVLLITKTKKSGVLDLGFAADVKRALEYDDSDLPALLFAAKPEIKVYPAYHNEELLKLKNHPLDGLSITLGGCSPDAVNRFMKKLPSVLNGANVPVKELEKLLKSSKSEAMRATVTRTAKNVGNKAAQIGPGLITIVSHILKWTGHWHGPLPGGGG